MTSGGGTGTGTRNDVFCTTVGLRRSVGRWGGGRRGGGVGRMWRVGVRWMRIGMGIMFQYLCSILYIILYC